MYLQDVALSTTSMTAQLELGIRNNVAVRIPCKQPGSTLRCVISLEFDEAYWIEN